MKQPKLSVTIMVQTGDQVTGISNTIPVDVEAARRLATMLRSGPPGVSTAIMHLATYISEHGLAAWLQRNNEIR